MATTIAAEVHMHRLLASLIGIASVSLALHVSSAAAHGTLDGYEISEALETFLHAVDPKAVLQPAQAVDCTLSGGTKAKCAEFVLQPKPKRTGPWCPDYVSDRPEVGGFWIKDGGCLSVGASSRN